MELSNAKRKVLSDIYYNANNSASYGSQKALWSQAKKVKKPKISKIDIKKFFQLETVPSRYANARISFNRAIFVVGSAFATVVGDLADMGSEMARFNGRCRYILIVQDLFSRYIMGLKAQVTKTSSETARNLNAIFSTKRKIRIYLSDQGTEFLGACIGVYARHNIKHQETTGVVSKAQTVERSIQNVKRVLYKMMEHHATNRWVDFLKSVKNQQNKKYHRILKMTPNAAIKKVNQWKVFRNTVSIPEMRNFKTLAQRKSVFKFNQDDVVRIIRYETFKKSYKGVWTQTLYRISSRALKSNIPTYQLQEWLTGEPVIGVWYEKELSLVDVPDQKELPKVQKIFGRRMNENKEEVSVKLSDSAKRVWMPIANLMPSH